MPADSAQPLRRRHKLMLQSVAFVLMMLLPGGLYFIAQTESEIGVLALLVALGGAMLLAAWAG